MHTTRLEYVIIISGVSVSFFGLCLVCFSGACSVSVSLASESATAMTSTSPGLGSKPKGQGRGRGRGRGASKQSIPPRSPGFEVGGVPHPRPEDCIFVGDLVVYKTQCLGGGAFGSVFKGTFREQPCAVKVLNHLATQLTSPFPAAGATKEKDLARFNKECRFLEKYNHRNIVKHLSTMIEPTSKLPVLVMELMDENLTTFLGQPGSEYSVFLSLQLQISLSCDVACGLQYLHSNNIVHQDLCSDNVLLKHEGSLLIAKVSDFGISRIIDPDNLTRSLRTVSHRDAYMPPIPPSSDSSIYDTSLDIFSFGVVAVQIVMKVPTVAHPRDRDSLVQKIESSHPLRELIVCCLHKDKEKRPKTSDICRYLTDLSNAGEGNVKDVQQFQHEKAELQSSAVGGEPHQRPEDVILVGSLVVYKKQSLGGGAFGSVFKGTFGGQPCAVKVLVHHAVQLTSPFPAAGATRDEDLARFNKECRLIESHNHRNIVKHMSTLIEPESNLPLLVMELMDENLTMFLGQPASKSSTLLFLQLQISLSCDVACGLQYLHSNNIVHQDLCSDNVLLKHEGSLLIAKVSDFGISRIIDPDNLTRSLRTVSHRDAYMPPIPPSSDSSIYDTSLDIFSFGVVAVQIVMKVPKVAHPRDRDSLVQKIESSHPLREVIVCCLHKDKEKRPKTSEVCHYLTDLSNTGGEKLKDVQPFRHGKAIVPCQLQSHAGSKVTVEVSSLPPHTSTEEIEHYFERQAGHIEVLSTVHLDGGNARVELSGLTYEELEKLQKKQHKIKEQPVHLKVSVDNIATVSELPPQPNIHPDTLEVSDLPPDADTELLKLYFESSKSGSHNDAVEKCSIVVQGTAHIKFQSPEDHEVAAQVMSVQEHKILGSKVHLQYADLEKTGKQYESNKLLIRQIPQQVTEKHLQLFLEGTLRLDPQDDFAVEVRSGGAMITFLNAQFSNEDLIEMISKIGSKTLKGASLQGELCKVINSIRVHEIIDNYTEEDIQLYFESPKQSGGGKVVSIQLLGNGEAIVTFQDPRVIDSVLLKAHSFFGDKTFVEIEDPLGIVPQANIPPRERTSPEGDQLIANNSNPYHPLLIPIDPVVAKSLQKDSTGLRECVQSLNVDVTIDETSKVIQITHTTRTIAGWKQKAKQLASSYIHSNYKTVEISFPKEATNELKQYLEEERSLAFLLNQDSLLLKATGDPAAISVFQTRADDICSAYAQTSDKVELKEEDYDFFTQVQATQSDNVHSDVGIQYDFENHALILHGSVQSVAHFKKLLPEYLVHVSVRVELDSLIIYYFSTDIGREQLNNFIKNKRCPIAIHFQQVQSSPQLTLLFLCHFNEIGLAESVSRSLQEETSAKSHPLIETFAQKLPEFEEEYQQLCENLQMQQHVKIFTSDNKIEVAGFNRGVSESLQCIIKFVQEKCNATSDVEIKKGIWRLFCGPMQKRWQSDIVAQCNRNGVELTELDEGDRMVIQLKGDATLVAKFCQAVDDIAKSVQVESISISRPGTCKYFQENEHAVTLLAGIEKTEQVCIEKSVIDDSISDDAAGLANSPGATKLCMARTEGMKQIVLYVGDITEFDKADVMVNAANGELQHVGGVARAIADKGGPVIQQESSQYVRRCGRLDDGDVWLTTKVGKLPCKALIHAVGPQWSGGHSKEEALLSKACTQSLQKACKYRSIAFPAISSGIFDFPMDRCAHTLIDAAVTFCDKNPFSELQEINFILFKQSDAHAFLQALEAKLPEENIIMNSPQYSYPVFHSPHAGTQSPRVKTATKKKTKKAVATLQDYIILRQGSLTEMKADVYVNTTNTNLDLSFGEVAQALSKAAGPTLQAECTNKAPISVGEIAVTGGGRLQSRYVFHVVASQYDHQAEKELQELVNKCLKECTKLRVTSIAFPAIGTGNLGYPNDVVARVMVETISSFLSSHKSSTLNAVYLVTYMEDTHRAFQQELANKNLIPETSYSPMPSLSQDIDTSRRSSHKRSSRHIAATASPQSVSSQQTFKLGTIQVQILSGDITDDSSDAVVNPTNSELQLEGPGVSGALLQKGGEELQRVCNTLTSQGLRLQEGKVLHTPATGTLKCRFVFHILFESKDQKKFLKTITACLNKAEELKCNSIAFPAIGTGAHGYPPDAAARGMMKAIDQFATSKVTQITCVRIVLFLQDVYQAFLAVFNDPESLSRPGLWQRTKDFVGSILPTWSGSTEDDESLTVSHPPSLSYEQMMYRDIKLVIYGETQGAVQRAVDKLQSFINAQFITDSVDNPNVGKLTRSEIENLEYTGNQMHVELDINPAPLNFIRLKGDKADVHKMRSYIFQTLSDVERRIFKQREAEQLQNLVQWKRMDSEEETEYDVIENYEIELAYSAKKPSYTHHTAAEHYTVDFKSMEEIDHNINKRFPIVRVDIVKQLQDSEKASHWDPMPIDPQTGKEFPLHCVDLIPGSKEYNEVLQEFNKTMTMVPMPVAAPTTVFYQPNLYESDNTYNTIVKIQRIQNPMLYSQYIAKKKDMEKHNPPGHRNERRLFHGTPADVCPKINQQGFNRSFAGRNATAIGHGVYFARDASYSAQHTYSEPDANGEKYMYLARVLVGEFTEGDSSMIIPPPKDPLDPNIPFDSVVDNISNPIMYVVSFDAQTYPEYLIVFK